MSRITSVFYGTKMLSVLKMKKKQIEIEHLKKMDVDFCFRFVSLTCVVMLVVYRLFAQSCN